MADTDNTQSNNNKSKIVFPTEKTLLKPLN